MTPIILTAAQAAELHTTGRLTGYREKCEWQPEFEITAEMRTDSIDGYYLLITPSGKCGVLSPYLTPPRDTDTTYAVKEPCIVIQHDGTIDDCIEYGELSFSAFPDRDTRAVTLPPEMLAELGNAGWKAFTADEMPDWAERMKAKIDNIQLVIEDGSLLWVYEVRKVG